MGYKGHTNYSSDLRKKVIEAHQKGQSTRQIAKELSVPKSSVHNIITRFERLGIVDDLTKFNGAKKKTEPKMDGHILELAKNHPTMTIRDIQADLKSKGLELSRHTIGRRLKEANLPMPSTLIKKAKSSGIVKKSRPPEPQQTLVSKNESAIPTFEQLLAENQRLKEVISDLREETYQLRQTVQVKDTLLHQTRMCYSCQHYSQ